MENQSKLTGQCAWLSYSLRTRANTLTTVVLGIVAKPCPGLFLKYMFINFLLWSIAICCLTNTF